MDKQNQSDKLLIKGHQYDGIQEFDNPTPLWWHLIWLFTMVFSVVYFFLSLESPWFVHQTDRLAAAQLAETARLFGALGDLQADEATLVSLMQDEKWMDFGASIFQMHCTSCHAADGGGGIGPNLTDDNYINVTSITDIHTIIVDGANNGAMPAWGNRMHPKEAVLLSSYVASLRGNNSNRKAPEGEIIAPWPAAEEGG